MAAANIFRLAYSLLPTALLCVCSLGWAAEEFIVVEDGSEVKVLFFEPEGDAPKPLALFVAGGSSNEFMARAQFWLGREFVQRGWAIAVPISPDGKAFSASNAGVFPALINELRRSHSLTARKPLLVGISSGGSAALAIAIKNPDTYAGVVATPGRVDRDSQFTDLNDLPIYLRIGALDSFYWNRSLESMVDDLHRGGASVDAALVPEAKHIFKLDWDNLESWLSKLESVN